MLWLILFISLLAGAFLGFVWKNMKAGIFIGTGVAFVMMPMLRLILYWNKSSKKVTEETEAR